MLKNLNAGTVIAATAIIYVGIMLLLDWNTTAVIIGALTVALVADTAGRPIGTQK
ncbi:MAG: hypothetical protein WKF81_11405 [Thermomicrobiales bacterium]